jgi:hypothetical protein
MPLFLDLRILFEDECHDTVDVTMLGVKYDDEILLQQEEPFLVER